MLKVLCLETDWSTIALERDGIQKYMCYVLNHSLVFFNNLPLDEEQVFDTLDTVPVLWQFLLLLAVRRRIVLIC